MPVRSVDGLTVQHSLDAPARSRPETGRHQAALPVIVAAAFIATPGIFTVNVAILSMQRTLPGRGYCYGAVQAAEPTSAAGQEAGDVRRR